MSTQDKAAEILDDHTFNKLYDVCDGTGCDWVGHLASPTFGQHLATLLAEAGLLAP